MDNTGKTNPTPKLWLIGIWLVLSYWLFMGMKACDKYPKCQFQLGTYQGKRPGATYRIEAYEGSNHTFTSELTFTTPAGPSTCNCGFRYNPMSEDYLALYHEGYCDCLVTLLRHVGVNGDQLAVETWGKHCETSGLNDGVWIVRLFRVG